MSERKPQFGGPGRKQGDSTADPMGTVRRSPDGYWLAIMWPSPPSADSWHVIDYYGSGGYERPERVAHWPVIGSVPGSPAAGMSLNRPEPTADAARIERRATLQRVATVELPGGVA